MTAPQVTACVSGCTTRGRHLPDCATPQDCRGCQPRPPVPGGLVCVTCWERTTDRLSDLPDLHADLLTPTRATTSTGRVTGTAETRMVLADAPRWAREGIERCLTEWLKILMRPAEPPQSRTDAYRAAQNRGETPDPLPAPPYGRGLTLPTLTARITRHADWLLTQPEYAAQLVHDIAYVHGQATRDAYPAAPAGIPIGVCPIPVDDGTGGTRPCGTPLRGTASADLIICDGCGTAADPYWWHDRLHDTGTTRPPTADAYALAAWLTVRHRVPIHADDIRRWSTRGTRTAGRLPSLGRHPSTQRVLFVTVQAAAYAARLYPLPEEAPADAGPD